jgi:hypothetical protein
LIYAAIGNELRASNIFSALSLFNSAIIGLIIMPNVAKNFSGTYSSVSIYSFFVAAQVGLDRLQKFLLKPDLVDLRTASTISQHPVVKIRYMLLPVEDPFFDTEFRNASFKIDLTVEAPELVNKSVEVGDKGEKDVQMDFDGKCNVNRK